MRTLRVLLIFVATALVAGCALLGSERDEGVAGWRLVYAVKADGSPIAGDKATLIRSVRAGLPVRVGWGETWSGADGFPGTIEHVADARFLSIYKGEVFAQVEEGLTERPDPARPSIDLLDRGHWVGMLDTTGRLRALRSGPNDQGSVDSRVPVYWYVPWRSDQTPADVDIPAQLN